MPNFDNWKPLTATRGSKLSSLALSYSHETYTIVLTETRHVPSNILYPTETSAERLDNFLTLNLPMSSLSPETHFGGRVLFNHANTVRVSS
jgi:hypothetical protein